MPRPHRPVVVALALLLHAALADAQGVGINGTGASADGSAMLDVASTTRGFLPPRMTAAQRAAIASPATGLTVYQIDGVPGLYTNAGTPAAPNWQLAGPGQGAGQWTVSGSDLYYTAGKVAVGTTPGAYALTLSDPSNGLRVVTGNTGGSLASFGSAGLFDVDAPFVPGGRLRLLENGALGLGTTTPTAPLSFGSTLGKKISLWHSGPNTDYGLSIATNQLRLHGGGAGAGVALGYDDAGTFVEKLAVGPTGAIAVSGNEGYTGEVLTSRGAGARAVWGPPPVPVQVKGTGNVNLNVGQEADVPGLVQTVTVPPQGGDVLVLYHVYAQIGIGCVLCMQSHPGLRLMANGASVGGASGEITDFDAPISLDGSQLLTSLPSGTNTISIRATVFGGEPANIGLGAQGLGGSYSTLITQVFPR